MINIRKDLIEKELERDIENGFIYTQKQLSSYFIDNLFLVYYPKEVCENFYDSEPDINDYISDIAFMSELAEEEINNDDDYFTRKYILKKYNKEYNKEEAKKAKEYIKGVYKEYANSERRLRFCNWQEIYSKGVWNMSQQDVDKEAKEALEKFGRNSFDKKDRVYIGEKDDEIRIYLYGRDIGNRDWWFVFKKKDIFKEKNRSYKKKK